MHRVWTVLVVLACLSTWVHARADQPPQDVAFVARCDGSTQHYVLVFPPGFDPKKPCHLLVALHGHGSDRWQFAKQPRDECRVTREVAAAHGMLLVSPDYRAKTSWMGPRAEADTLQILDELQARYRIGKVIVCGASMGGSSALTFAALHPDRVAGVVSMNGTANHVEYANFQDAIAESFGGTKAQVPDEYRKRSAELQARRLLKMPIAFTAGGKDASVPPASVIRLAAALGKVQPNVLMIFREGGGHSTTFADGKQALEFVIDKAIGAGPNR